MLKRVSRVASLFMAGVLLLAGCGDDKPATPAASGHMTVFAASSLTGAFTEIGKAFNTAHPGVTITFNFGASSSLAQQITGGATADVFAAADQASMTKLAEGRFARPRAVFAHNRLVIVTKPGNPLKITKVADLATAGVVSLCGAEVPCGKYAAELLKTVGVTIPETKVTRGQNVAATLTAVTDGDAVAGIVYATDALAAGNRVATVAVPAAQLVIASYPIAVLRHAPNAAAARAFVAYVRSDAGQRVLRRFGFLKA